MHPNYKEEEEQKTVRASDQLRIPTQAPPQVDQVTKEDVVEKRSFMLTLRIRYVLNNFYFHQNNQK